MNPEINGKPIRHDSLVEIEAGDILTFGRLDLGLRAYLAIGGKWMVPSLLESNSVLYSLGPLKNRGLWIQKGDVLEINSTDHEYPQNVDLDVSSLPKVRDVNCIDVMPGPEFGSFEGTFVAIFFSTVFEVSNSSNRMAYKLDKYQKFTTSLPAMISSGVLPGTIQINNDGQPMILLSDAQTVGGYPRFLRIIETDLDLFGQLKPGDRLRFSMNRTIT
jgi:antagonist of KipI